MQVDCNHFYQWKCIFITVNFLPFIGKFMDDGLKTDRPGKKAESPVNETWPPQLLHEGKVKRIKLRPTLAQAAAFTEAKVKVSCAMKLTAAAAVLDQFDPTFKKCQPLSKNGNLLKIFLSVLYSTFYIQPSGLWTRWLYCTLRSHMASMQTSDAEIFLQVKTDHVIFCRTKHSNYNEY